MRPATPGAPGTAGGPAIDPPRWLTYRCVRCGSRVYSGFTSTALARAVRGLGSVKPDFFHADCATETPLEQADLRYDDGAPWRPEDASDVR